MPTRIFIMLGMLFSSPTITWAEAPATAPQPRPIVEFPTPTSSRGIGANPSNAPLKDLNPNPASPKPKQTKPGGLRRNLLRQGKDKTSLNQNGKSGITGLSGQRPISTVLGGLAIVLGAFFLFAWIFKKGLPKSTSRLPKDVIEVLGRTTISPKQIVHLVRLGNKLLLINFAPTGAETLAEVTDPDEVTRLLALCNSGGDGSSKAFQEAFEQFSQTKTTGFLGRS